VLGLERSGGKGERQTRMSAPPGIRADKNVCPTGYQGRQECLPHLLFQGHLLLRTNWHLYPTETKCR
jgi:hypothetical protein